MNSKFKNPDEVYRGLDLWMVNDRLEDDELIHQVEEFREKGLYSVIFRTYNGLCSDYPGEDYMHKAEVAIKAAERVGLKITLQAGYMPAANPIVSEEDTLRRILPKKVTELTGDETVICTYDGIAYTEVLATASVDLLNEEAVARYLKMTYEDMWDRFSEHFGKTIISVWVDEPRFDPHFMVHPKGIDKRFREKYGYSVDENLYQLYVDVGDYKKIRYQYYTLIADLMAKCYFIPLRDWCHAHNLTFSGHLMGEELLRHQIDEAAAIMPYYKYFDIPGIDVLRVDLNWYDKPLTPVQTKHPGHWRPAETGVERSNYVNPIQCSSAAEQAGKEHVLCEMYGVTSPNLSFRDMMHTFDLFAVNGINHQCMHALFYSIKGFRKRFYPQQFNTYQPFWNNFRNVKDYVARTAAFASFGKCTTDLMVLHPLHTAYGLHAGTIEPYDKLPASQAAIRDYDLRWYQHLMSLLGSRISFHYGDMMTIETEGAVDKDRFVIGKMAYKTVVLPETETITSKTLALLKEFAANGGKVIASHCLPTRVDGEYCAELPEIIRSLPNFTFCPDDESLLRVLKAMPAPYEYITETNTPATLIRYRADEEHGYFTIVNNDCRSAETGRLVLDGCYTAIRCNAETGEETAVETYTENGKTIIPVHNTAGGSTLLMTSRATELPVGAPDPKPVTILPIKGFTCETTLPNLYTLERCSYKTEKMDDFSEKEYVTERIMEKLKTERYTGSITMRFRFYTDFAAKNLRLVAEEPEKCEFTLNGVTVDKTDKGYFWDRSFRVLQLPDAVQPGENVLEITRFTTPPVVESIGGGLKHLFELFRDPVGVDLERVHLLGDFSVEGYPEISHGGLSRYAPRFMMTERKTLPAVSDLTAYGLPFYTGSVIYRTTVKVTEDMLKANDVCLAVRKYNAATANLTVNGKKVGSIDRDPYTLSVKDALVVGENKIEIEIFNTIRNMIGPSHLIDLDDASCNRSTWSLHPEYTEYTEYDAGIITNSFVLSPFGIGDVILEMR